MLRKDPYLPFYGWILLIGLMAFGAFLLTQHQLWNVLLENDQTYLSRIILFIFVLSSLYLGWCTFRMALQDKALRQQTTGWAADYFELLDVARQDYQQNQAEALQARLVEQVQGSHSHGWFIADLLLRLGLIGTVIGFVLMLGSVEALQGDGVKALKDLMSKMGTGMQVALYTTLTGLGAAVLLSLQCQWLDRCGDRLISAIIASGIRRNEG